MTAKSPQEAAELIRKDVNPNFENEGHRDEVYLGAVCSALALDDNPINRAQVGVLLHAKGMVTHQEYPKAKYKALGTELDVTGRLPYTVVTVASPDEEKALGKDWGDQPPQPTPARDDAKASKSTKADKE